MVLMLCCVHLIADVTIEKTSLQAQNHFTVTILADDTDIFCLFLHHIYYSNYKKEIYIKNMYIQSSKGEKVRYNIRDIINSTEKEYLEHLFFCHAFIGCDTTAQTHNFGKKSIFSTLKKSKGLPSCFYQNSATVNEIRNAIIRFFEFIQLATNKKPEV